MRGGVCCLVGSGLGTWMAEEVLSSFLSSYVSSFVDRVVFL